MASPIEASFMHFLKYKQLLPGPKGSHVSSQSMGEYVEAPQAHTVIPAEHLCGMKIQARIPR